MLITPESLRTLFIAYKNSFQGGLSHAQSLYQQLATIVPSTTGTEEYGWLGEMPGMREWIGDRVIHGLESHGYTVKNKSFELTVGVPRTAIVDDTYGTFKPMMTELGRSAGAQPDQMVFGLLKAGDTAKCYDGKAFFADNHPVKSASGKNEAQSNADLGGNGPTWYVLDTTRSIKPLIFQDRQKPNFVSLTNTNDANVFYQDKYVYGVDSRNNAGLGFWQMAYASNEELNEENLWKAIENIGSRKGDGGRPLGLRANLLVTPSNLERQGTKLLTADLVAAAGGGTETNSLKGRLTPLVSPWLD